MGFAACVGGNGGFLVRGDGLRQVAGVGVAELFAHYGVGLQLGLGDHPAHAQAGAQHFAERPTVGNPFA